MDYNLTTGQLQEQVQMLSPKMIQSLHVLQMPSTELYEYLMKEIEGNPVINFDSIDIAERKRRSVQPYEKDAVSQDEDETERLSGSSPPPDVSLKLQLSMLRPSAEIEQIGYMLIDMLDENGYLSRRDVDRLIKSANVPEDKLDAALELLQSIEPAGVGAFDPRDCILLQLERKGLIGSDAWMVAKDYLQQLGKNKLPEIAKKSGIPLHRVANAQQLIRTLNPRPLLQDGGGVQSEYITPDIRILKTHNGFVVELNQLSADNISIDQTYSRILKETDNENVKSFLAENMKKAQWLRDSIRQRCETLMDCTSQLLNAQRGFFEYGPEALLPYSRREMAEQLGRSESTISRALKDKYIECDWGMFTADYFFPKQTVTKSPLMTQVTLESAIQDIISSEDSQNPMSDEIIVERLKKMGIDVSRRTVAKYRDKLGIPASSRRKTFA